MKLFGQYYSFPYLRKIMGDATEIIFWISFFFIFYAYAGYPVLLVLLNILKNKYWKSVVYKTDTHQLPHVTLIVAAYNEENIIEQKIINCLEIDYPANALQIIFITDGSNDKTASIVERYPQLIHLHQNIRSGKLAAMNRVMGQVNTPIVVFSDANTILNKESIQRMVVHYNDPRVGAVAGEKKVFADEGSAASGEGLYWKYESTLKRLDSNLLTVVGAAGELFSIRTALYTSLPEHTIIEDFVQSLLLCIKGKVVRYEPGAFSLERASVSIRDEMERKVRISAGAFQGMWMVRPLFNIFRCPVAGFLFISHRVLRWTACPVALVLMLLSSCIRFAAEGGVFFGVLTLLQLLFWAAAAIGWRAAVSNKHSKFFYLPFYFTLMHLSVFAGFSRFLSGSQQATWRKAERGKKI